MAAILDPAEYRLVRAVRRFGAGVRRVAARLLLAPVYAELAALRERQEELERQVAALRGRAFDQGAMARRLAALEDAVIELRQPSPQATDAVVSDPVLPPPKG
jgi:hypothetical protein